MAIQQMFFRSNALLGGNWSPVGSVVSTITSVSASDASVTVTIPTGRTIPYGNVVVIVYTDMSLLEGDIVDSGGNTWDAFSNTRSPARIGIAWSQLTTSLFPGDTILLPPVDDGISSSQTRMVAVYEFAVPTGFVVTRDGFSLDGNSGAAPAAASIESVSEERLFVRMLNGSDTAGNGNPTLGWTEMADTRTGTGSRHLYVEFKDSVGSAISQPSLSSATDYNSLMVGFKLTDPSITPTPTPTSTVTPTVTPTISVTPSVSATPAGPTESATPTPTVTPTATVTPTISVTPTPSTSATAVTPGTYAYVADSATDNVSVIDTSTNTVYSTFAVGDEPTDIAVNQLLDKVYVANYGSDNVTVINASFNTTIDLITVGNGPTRLAFNPDYSKLYVINKLAGTISVITTSTDTVTATITLDVGIDAAVINTAGTKMYVANTTTDEVKTIDLSTNGVINTKTFTALGEGIAIYPDDSKVVVIDGGFVRIMQTSDYSLGSAYGAPGGGSFSKVLGVDASGNWYVTEGAGLVISTGLGSPYTQLALGSAAMREVAFTADGAYAYITQGSSTVKVINTSTKAVAATITCENGTAGVDIVYLITPTPTSTTTPTPTPTSTVTPTISVTPSVTATVTPTVTPTISVTPSVTATITPTPSVTPSSSAPAEIDPSTLSPMAWYDFSDTTKMPTSTVGATIASYTDKSGNGHSLTTAASGNRPTLAQAANGRLYLDFDGTNDYFTLSSASLSTFGFLHSTNTVGYTVFASFWPEDTSGRDVLVATNNSSSTNVGWAFWNEASPTAGVRNFCTYVSGSQQGSTSTSGSKHGGNVVASIRRDSSDRAVTINVNGTVENTYTATTTTNTTNSNKTLTIGAHNAGSPSDYFNGRIYQIIIFNTTLTPTQVAGITAYLQARLGN